MTPHVTRPANNTRVHMYIHIDTCMCVHMHTHEQFETPRKESTSIDGFISRHKEKGSSRINYPV